MASYKKMDGFAKTDGQDLEVIMSALLYLRAVNANLSFQLASNAHGVGTFDDIVFRVRDNTTDNWSTCLIQTKHKQKKKFTMTLAMFVNMKGDYSLPKYLDSFNKIKEVMSTTAGDDSNPYVNLLDGKLEDSVFVLFTNAKLHASLERAGDAFGGVFEQYLRTNDNGKVLGFSSACVEISNALGDDATFRNQLKLLYSQASLHELEELIRKELNQLGVDGVYLEAVYNTFLAAMKEWWATLGVALVLCDDAMFRDAVALVKVRSLSQEEECKARLKVNFQHTTLPLDKVWTLLHIQSSEPSSLLSCTKLLQASKDPYLFLGVDALLANRESVLSVWKRSDIKTLIVHVSEQQPVDFLDLGQRLFDALDASESGRRAVIVSHADNPLTVTLSDLLQARFQCCQDTFDFSHIGDSDWTTLDDKFELQGCAVPLRTFLAGDCDHAGDAIKWAFLVDVIKLKKGKLSVGSALPEDIGYFIPRTLERATAFLTSILEGSRLSQSITVLYSSAEEVNDLLRKLDPGFKSLSETFAEDPPFPRHDTEVCCGAVRVLGHRECSNIYLRTGQADQVTALRLRRAVGDTCFLFIGEDVNNSDVATLSEFNGSKHFFRLEGGDLLWVKSVCSLDGIRTHLRRDAGSVTIADIQERVVLLCAEPGMGKSTLLSHVARHLKTASPESWVVQISLNDQTKLFHEGVHTDALKFLLAALKIESPSHRAMFELAVTRWGNVAVLLDGFDEIAPRYAGACRLLLTKLIATRVRTVWITSRNTMKGELEEHLHLFANTLRKFSVDDQRSFFQKYWREKSASLDEGRKCEVEAFITQLIEMTARAVSDRERDLMGIPLQTQMVAEVYENHVPGTTWATPLPSKIDLLDLLERFVTKKFDIYVGEKLGLETHRPDFEQLCIALRSKLDDGHMAAALVTVLSADDLAGLDESIENESLALCEEIQLGNEKTGIVDGVADGRPRFVHRVYAEFFVAKWLVLNFKGHAEFVRKHLFTANFRVVRHIFDRMLASGHALHTAVLNEDVQAARLALDDVDVNSKDRGGRTALHLAASFGPIEGEAQVQRCRDMLDIFEHADVDEEDEVLKGSPVTYAGITESWIAVDRFVSQHGIESESLIHTAAQVESHAFLDYVFSMDLVALVGHYLDVKCEDKETPQELLSRACYSGSTNIARLLIERGVDVIEEGNLPSLSFHVACKNGHLAVVKLIHEKAVDALVRRDGGDPRNVSADFINRKDSKGTNALAHAANCHHLDVVEYVVEQGADLRSCTRHLMLAVENSWLEDLRVLEFLLGSIPDADERSAYVNTPESPSLRTAVHVAIKERSLEALKLFVEAGGELGPVGKTRTTALMAACCPEAFAWDTVEYILAAVEEKTGMNAAEFINLQDKKGRTALQHNLGHNKALLHHLLTRGADVWIQDNAGRTVWHEGARRGDMDTLITVYDSIPIDKREEYLARGDGNGDTAMHWLARCWWIDLKQIEVIIGTGVKMTQRNKAGQTPLMLACLNDSGPKVRLILSTFREEIEGCTVSQYVAQRDGERKTALHYAARSLFVCSSKEVLMLLVNAVPETDRPAFVNAKDIDGNTAIDIILQKNNPPKDAVKYLLLEGRTRE